MNSIYKDKNDLLFRTSFCAYIDILGFAKKIENNDLDFFNIYLETLKKELQRIDDAHDLLGKKGFKSFELKIFTDNFVFGHPWFDQSGESELGNIFDVLANIQFTFVKSNVFFRGAISMSDLYMDENIVLGPAVLESYKLETEKAIYPRIILSEGVAEIVKRHISFYSDHSHSPQNKQYLIDIDGVHFVNYLYILFNDDNYAENMIISELISHKEPIIRNLNLHMNDFKLFDKYSWCAKYHNYFCDNFITSRFPHIDLKKIKIEGKLYKRHIRKLV